MFSYILSFFQKSDPELTLEEASAILEDEGLTGLEAPIDEIDLNRRSRGFMLEKYDNETSKSEYNFFTKQGTITGEMDGTFIIDSQYEFSPDDMEQSLEVGDRISYQILMSEGKVVIYNVTHINNDWDLVSPRQATAATRIIICKVERREKRNIILSPGDIKVNLDRVSIEFIPHTGDWLEAEVKYEVDENALDLSGKVIEVYKLSPLRPHIETGKVTSWSCEDNIGTINNKIFINKDSLSCGYVPVVGDKTIAEIIESEQNSCTWRALKVLPEFISNRFKNIDNTCSSPRKFEINHPGLNISDCHLNFDKLGQSQEFSIKLENKGQEVFELVGVNVAENAQIFLTTCLSKPKQILPDCSIKIDFCCTSKTMGTSNEPIEFLFETFTLAKYVNISVNLNTTGGFYQRNNYVSSYNNSYHSNKQLIRGQKRHNVKFAAVQLPDYPLPKRLLDLVMKYGGSDKDNVSLIEELKILKRNLFSNLCAANYEEKFHTLLHMDEIVNLLHIKQYDQDRAVFIPNKEFLMLEIENLAERRPSIVIGDRIIVCDPFGNSDEEYEGNVFKVGAKHVYLKFSSMFHDTYRGDDYSIRVIPGRSSYRRQHHAIYLVARNLGRDWLFPTKVIEKQSQAKFLFEPISSTKVGLCETTQPEDVTSSKSRRLLSAPELIRKAREARLRAEKEKLNNSVLLDQDGNRSFETEGLKIEWFNKNLNCKQKEAVINILKGVSRPLPYIVFGPPGTGKTVTVIESILQVVRLLPECRILVAAPSNSAADLIALRLIDSGVLKPGNLVRLVSVNYAMGDNIPAKLIPYCATGSVAKAGSTDENILAQNGMTFDCSRAVLGRHKITVTTCSSSGVLHSMAFPRGHFSHIFVDEAGQASEPEVMIPVSFLDKYAGQIVLAGDPMQLGPVVLCRIASECGLEESYLERLTNRFPYARDIEGFPESEGYDPRLVTKLLYNYRSLGTILELFSSLFYHGDLIPTVSATESKESRLLDSLASILPKTKNGQVPAVIFHGVEGENYQTPDSPSWYNPHEAAQVFFYVNELLRVGVQAKDVGIITPYNKQVREIRSIFREAEFPLPKVGTVEDFQGQEFDVVLLSTVRSSRDYVSSDLQHSLGFVSSPRRLNVAISRPKALLIIIGNPRLLSHDTYWRTVINYCLKCGAYTGCSF